MCFFDVLIQQTQLQTERQLLVGYHHTKRQWISPYVSVISVIAQRILIKVANLKLSGELISIPGASEKYKES
jgi:hypothetical protein